MQSISFPNIFSGAKTNLVEDNKATLQNMRLLFHSDKGALFGDPYFGSKLKRYIFEQNNIILRDIIIDDILVLIQTFIPQVAVTRKDIKLVSDKATIYAEVNCINKLDNEPNLFRISLMTD